MNPKKVGILALVAGALALSTACKPKKLMINDVFVPGYAKVARISVKPVGGAKGEDDVQLSNFYIQVCDIQGNTASMCKTTLVMENITNFTYTPVNTL